MADSSKNKGKPNILLIMVDQMTPFLTGAYGHPVVKTPNLDRLVEDGIRFDAAYTNCPLCAPARASFMTGQYVSRIGCYDNAAPLSCAEPTIAHYLSLEGYDTVLSGKWLHSFHHKVTKFPKDFLVLFVVFPWRRPQGQVCGGILANNTQEAGYRGVELEQETLQQIRNHLRRTNL